MAEDFNTYEEYIINELKNFKKQANEQIQTIVNLQQENERLKKEVIWSIDKLTNTIMFFININNHKLPDITKYESTTLYEKIDRYPEEVMKIFSDFMEENGKQKIIL